MRKIGERVGVMSHISGDTVFIYGYGTYEGDSVPHDAVGSIADYLCEQGIANPRIRLDNGKVIYGCECWFGSEDSIRSTVAKYESVVLIDIDMCRDNQRQGRS